MTLKDLWNKLDAIAIIGFLIALETQISNGSMSFAHTLPAAWIEIVKEWAANLASAGGLLVGIMRLASNGAQPPSITSTIVKVLIVAFVVSAFLFVDPASAGTAQIGPIGQKIVSDFDKTKAAVTTGQQPSDPKAALPCMDITVLTKLTIANLVPTMKACVQDLNNQLVTDTRRALESAKAYTPTGKDTAVGDSDAVNCLSPALALFQAAAVVPAVPDTPAVLNDDDSVKTPAKPGSSELKPGPMLLFQKYREFTIAGGLTSCQTWVNGPVNATTAAGVAGAGTALVGAALLAK